MFKNIEPQTLHSLDMVFCIDRACPYCSRFLEEHFRKFYRDITEDYAKKNGQLKYFRTRIVAFHSYAYDDYPMLVTDFFNLPDDEDAIMKILSGINSCGVPYPSDGLEGLAYAIKSDWASYDDVTEKKQLIIVLTSNPTNHIGFLKSSPAYPKGMAEDFDALTAWWNDSKIIDSTAKRLLLLSPDGKEWNKILSEWNNVVHYPVEQDSFVSGLNFYYES